MAPDTGKRTAKKKPAVKVKYEHCEVFVLGISMKCPLCGVTVASGTNHQCSRPQP